MFSSRCMNIVDMLTVVCFCGKISNRIFDTKRSDEAYSWWDTPFVILEGVLTCNSGHSADGSK
jgi:hypothetical protein